MLAFCQRLAAIFSDIKLLIERHTQTKPRKPNNKGRTFRRWAVPVILGLVFLILFSEANPIIHKWFEGFFELLKHPIDFIIEHISIPRVVFWLFSSIGIWAYLRAKVKAPPKKAPTVTKAHKAPFLGAFIHTESITRSLIVFNVIFAMQTALDIVVLIGGKALPEGVSYAHYAHRGAYPLIATALLAGLFVLLSFRPGGPAEEKPELRKLVYAWIAQNIFLMFSAMWRLSLYIEVYSLTRWRIAAAVWMLLVALGFLWICIRIVSKRSNTWLLRANILTLLTVLYISSFTNFDGAIAWYNVKHCKEISGQGTRIDLVYLERNRHREYPCTRLARSPAKTEPIHQTGC